jgi:hypothetical protein
MAPFDPTSASRAVLVEVANVLGAFRSDLVIVGGWVPELLYPERGHLGSLDVDLAVSPSAAAGSVYATICRRLLDAGYQHQSSPTRFVKSVEGVEQPVKVDLISGQYHGGLRVQNIQVDELQISTLRGLDLAFEASDEIVLEGTMPDGSQNSVRVRVVRPEAFLLIKAFALDERTKDKDAYDIAFVLQNHEPDVVALADPMRRLLATGLGREGYAILTAKFATLDSIGPSAAARVTREQGSDFAQAQREAFEYAQALFRAVGSE